MSVDETVTIMAGPSANDGVAQPQDRFNALGIPVDNLDMAQACDRIVDLVYRYPRERKASYVSTVNVDFLVNALGVAGSAARHPELLEVLRSSDMVTADGFPVVLLSKLMGCPLRERVTGADLVPALAERAAKEGLRLYLFGGREAIAHEAASILEKSYPGLEIVGVHSPMVHTEGEALIHYLDDDEWIIDDINRSGADILLIGLGNPKQEQWFRRHRDRLRVPVSIGIGGTFEFIAGTVSRAPAWLQRCNLEWLYRITQDPVRLWKRYAGGLLKLGLLVAPLLLMRAREILLKEIHIGRRRVQPLRWTRFSGPNQVSAASIEFPRVVSADQLRQLVSELQCAPRRDVLYLFDFSATRRIEIAGMQALFELGRCLASGEVEGVYLGIHRSLRKQLGTWRLLDLFDREQLSASNLHVPLAQQRSLRGLPLRFYATDNCLVVYLHGDIDSDTLQRSGLDSVLSLLSKEQRCIVDFRFTGLVDSSAIAAFHRLAAVLDSDQLYFAGLSGSVRQMFSLARVPRQLRFVSDAQQRQLMLAA